MIAMLRRSTIIIGLLVWGSAWFAYAAPATAESAPAPSDMQLYLLVGQSNMAGRGQVSEIDRTAHPRVFMLTREGLWVPAIEPMHFDKPFAGVGPGLAFGKAMAEADSDAIIGLIPCAVGGSPIQVWTPGKYWKQTDSHPYDDTLRRVSEARKQGELAGVLWHQGEADSGPGKAPHYADRLDDLIARLRKDLDTPDVPIVVGGMSDGWMQQKPWAVTVNDALAGVPDRVSHTSFVSADGLGLKADNTHFTADAAREFGRRFAESMLRLQTVPSDSSSATE